MIAREIPSMPLIFIVRTCSTSRWSFLNEGSPASTTRARVFRSTFPTWRLTCWASPSFLNRSSSSGHVTPRDFMRWSSGNARTRMFTRSVSIDATSSRDVISISVAILRIFSRSPCPVFTPHDTRKPSADLLASVRDFLLAPVERERFPPDRQGRLRFRLRRFRGRLLRADRRPRLLAAWGGFHLNGGRPELLEDFLGLFLCDEFCEPLHLGRGQLFEREPRVGQDLGGLLGNPAVPQRLNRRRSGHRHSSDGGSSSSTSTSSSEISTYMSFSVRPYDAISCSRSRSFQEGSSPRTSCKMSSMSTARPWTLRDGSTPSSPNLNWMIVSAVFRTVPSSLTLRSSRALISRRCMYPDRDVRTAVSTSPSRPPIAWKKYSVGWRPLLYDDLTNPFASAPRSPFRK